MNTTFGTIKLAQTASRRHVIGFFARHWEAFHERRTRSKLHAALSDLSTRELQDIGIARGDIDYVVANRDVDPRWADHRPW